MSEPQEDEERELALVHNPTLPPVQEFEGELISKVVGRLPAIEVELQNGYKHGTHIRINVEVRVKNVRHDEDKTGQLGRHHIFELVSAKPVVAIDPKDLQDDIGGSNSAYPVPGPEATEELGVQFRRTSDTWDTGSAAGF